MDDNHDTLIGLHNILGDDEINYVFSWMHNLSMKEGSLFCFVVMRSTEAGCFRSCSLCLGKALNKEGWAWFHDVWTCGAKVLEY
jgi:hypothetical protein